MVFVTAILLSRASSFSAVATALVVIAAFVFYELILNVANNNPSIRTAMFVAIGFIFGFALTAILELETGALSAFICLLCMGYKYLAAKASAGSGPESRNVFVIFVNGLFYATMFTFVEFMAISKDGALYVMLYAASFMFILCSYVVYKRMEPEKRQGTSSAGAKGRTGSADVRGDFKHIIKRLFGYGKELRSQFEDALDNSGDTFSGLIREIRKRVVPDYRDSVEAGEDIRKEIERLRQEVNRVVSKEELTDNEIEILDRVNNELDKVFYVYFREGKIRDLEYETRISVITSDMEMLKNTLNIRKVREAEDREKEDVQSRRSRAQQARRKREREERERREREEREAREKEGYGEDGGDDERNRDEEERSREEERKRREEERNRQEKRRRERSRREYSSSENASGNDNGGRSGAKSGASGSTVADKTRYFKGCTTLDEVSLRYKKLCLIYHPDSGTGDTDTYIELKEEYEMLKKRLT